VSWRLRIQNVADTLLQSLRAPHKQLPNSHETVTVPQGNAYVVEENTVLRRRQGAIMSERIEGHEHRTIGVNKILKHACHTPPS